MLLFCFLLEVVEWQGSKSGRRSIKVKLDSDSASILVYTSKDNKKQPTRTIDCKGVKEIILMEIEGGKEPVLLVRVQRDYDLVSQAYHKSLLPNSRFHMLTHCLHVDINLLFIRY